MGAAFQLQIRSIASWHKVYEPVPFREGVTPYHCGSLANSTLAIIVKMGGKPDGTFRLFSYDLNSGTELLHPPWTNHLIPEDADGPFFGLKRIGSKLHLLGETGVCLKLRGMGQVRTDSGPGRRLCLREAQEARCADHSPLGFT